MKTFSQFTELKRPTIVSAPIKGQNQDQSGESPSHSTADYTISDEKKKSKKAVVEGFVAGVANLKTRSTPVTMQSAGSSHMKGASHLQHDADRRRIQLDKVAQRQREAQQKERDRQTKEREKEQQARSKQNEQYELDEAKGYKSQKELARRDASYKKFNSPSALAAKQKRIEAHMAAQRASDAAYKEKSVKEQIELDEAKRGRPPKNKSESDPGSDNIIMQLRKVISLRGQVPVTFIDGKKTAVSPATAHRLLAHYDNLRTTGEKHSFAARIHKSAESMRDVIAGKKEIIKPKISLGGTYRGN